VTGNGLSLRRSRSTNFIGKGIRIYCSKTELPSGLFKLEQLITTGTNGHCLVDIIADKDVLIVVYDYIRRSTKELAIDSFEKIASDIRTGRFKFTPAKPSDLIVLQVMHIVLNAIFKPNRVTVPFGSSRWIIEGDFSKCFYHKLLMKIIARKIKDQVFIDMLWKYLKTQSSGILSNILLDIWIANYGKPLHYELEKLN
jgi:hypothetical protein